MNADLLVKFLTVAARLDAFHQYSFRCHKRNFFPDMAVDDFFVYDQSVGNVHHEFEYAVRSHERFAHNYTPVGAVVQSAFEALHACGIGCVLRQRNEVSGERTYSFRAHGITLVCHCRRTDLLFVKRFFHFLFALQQAYVLSEFISALSKSRKRRKDEIIYLSGVCLPRNGYRRPEPERLDHIFVERLDLIVVAVEQRKETRLSARSAFDAAHYHIRHGMRNVFVVEQKILEPQRSALAHGNKLRRLKVRKSECGRFTVFNSEIL